MSRLYGNRALVVGAKFAAPNREDGGASVQVRRSLFFFNRVEKKIGPAFRSVLARVGVGVVVDATFASDLDEPIWRKIVGAGNPSWRGWFSTVDLLVLTS